MNPNALEVVSTGIFVADCVARPVIGTPAKGRLELVDSIGLYSGGSAASTGYSLARFGIKTAVIGRIGFDGFGDFMLAETKRHGAFPMLERDERAGTSSTLVTVDEDGERSFLHYIGANANLRPSDISLPELKTRGTRIIHVAGYFALPGMEGVDGSPTRDMFREARALGIQTSLDSVWDARGRWMQLIGSVLPETDFFCPSIHEARAMLGLSESATPLELATALFAAGVREIVALKMGEYGSFVMDKNGEHHSVGIANVPSIDGTGSGDAFIAGFLAARLKGLNLLEAAKCGNAAGAMCVRAVGAMTGITDWQELTQIAAGIQEVV
jgi:sugar/nucleoside kinase (ribokinase family)